MHLPTTPFKTVAAAAASAGLLLTGGVAAANAGWLPGAAQATARDALARVGVQVPGPDEHAAGHADTRGRSDEAPRASGEVDSQSDSAGTLPDASDFGQMIAHLAQTTAGGPDKGQTISEAASRGHSQAGEHGQAQAPEHPATGGGDTSAPNEGTAPAGQGGQSANHAPPVETPKNGGGTGTTDSATAAKGGSASTHGTGTATEKSGGHSTAGSGNAAP